MASQVILDSFSNLDAPVNGDQQSEDAGISLGGFQWSSVDEKFASELPRIPKVTPAPLGPLVSFNGTFKGNGFNTIFRPTNSATIIPSNIPAPRPTNTLLLCLTQETLAFADSLISVPNRGFGAQPDQKLNGVPYTQVVDDITDTNTGLPNPAIATGVHFEPGVWLYVPASDVSP